VITLFAELPYGVETGIKIGAAIGAFSLGAFAFVYVYLFKMMSFMQSRLGPMDSSPYGILQPAVEAVKFLQKEDVFPNRADRLVFGLAPFVVLISTLTLYIVVPAGPDLIVEDLDTGIFFALAVSSLSVLGILMAGWASANKYSLIGALRAAGQLIAYELPLVLGIVGVVIQAETLSLQGIVEAQRNFDVNLGFASIPVPYLLPQFVGFLVFLIAMQAELTQTPFDMPVAESELVAGYMTEYTGFRFLFFFLGEFGTAFAFSIIAATLFLGGWSLPGLGDGDMMNVIGPLVLFGKAMLIGFFIFWFRISYPRLREDQLQSFAWKFLIPVALVNIAVTGVAKVAF
jgi:NADH-quinone oxidoreductase subunit H